MKVVIQRVSKAKVEIGGKTKSAIQQGLLVLLGITAGDTKEDIDWLCRKISNMRVFDDENNQMNLSVNDLGGEVLVVSQFTLFATTKKGNRPSFINAAKPEIAEPLYEDFLTEMSNCVEKPVQSGVFGADMQLSLCNDGPVTIIIDSKNKI